MLRITVHNDDMQQCRLELAGGLAGPWVDETYNVWRALPCSEEKIEIDLRQVTGVDESGRELLAVMYRAGARLIARGVVMAALIEEITGDQTPARPAQQQRNNLSVGQCSRMRRNQK